MKKKIVIFSGAGISKESGILTFRDVKDGLWNNHKVEDVATIEGWKKDRAMVLDFYNERRRQLPDVHPNEAHIALASLEEEYDVTITTQNVDDLHERGGSTNILHLHGELTKAKGCYGGSRGPFSDVCESIDIGYNDINIGDKDDKFDSQLRPDIVWFGEYPKHINKAYQAVRNANILLIIGTSLQIGYTLDMLQNVRTDCQIIYIDPEPMHYLDNYGLKVEYITKTAVEGVTEVVNRLLTQAIGDDKNDK